MIVPAGRNTSPRHLARKQGCVLLVGADSACHADFSRQLSDLGFDLVTSSGGWQAIALLRDRHVDMVFARALLPDMACSEFITQLRAGSYGAYLPIVVLAAESDEDALRECLAAGADDFLNPIHGPAELDARIEATGRLSELKNSYRDSINEQVVARGILSVALSARRAAVDGMQVMSRSAAIFSGDLVLTARNPHGSVSIMLADFTGHGLSAAIGVLPVAEMFSVMTEKGFSPEVIFRNINTKLFTLLPKGMFMAACVVQINSDTRSACVLNCGMPEVYLLDSRRKQIKQRVRSTHIPLGISNEADSRIEFEEFDIEPEDVFILHSDGLTDAGDCDGNMFGSARLEQIIESHDDDIFEAIQAGFGRFIRDRKLSDDVTLVTVPCCEHLNRTRPECDLTALHQDVGGQAGWRVMIEVSGAGLRDIDPVSIIMKQYCKLDNFSASRERLRRVLTALYDNALNHGVLEVSHFVDESSDNKGNYDKARNRLFERSPSGFVRTELQQIVHRGNTSLLIRLEDSGRGFDHAGLMSGIRDENRHGIDRTKSGIALVARLCQSIHYRGKGNRVEAILADLDREMPISE